MSNPRKQHKKMQAALFFILSFTVIFAFNLIFPAYISPAEAQFWHREQNSSAQGHSGRNSASAQRQRGSREQSEPRRSFWDKLFGRFRSNSRDRQPQRPQISPAQPAAPKINVIAKNPDARRVLVIGDFTAAALADGLNRAYSDNADILVRSKTENASGLNRAEIYNWPASITAITAQEKPNLIIVMLGANDRQPLKLAGKQVDFGTEDWIKAYKIRVQSFVQALQKSNAAWIWVGLPAFKQDNLNEAALALNRLYKQATEQAGGHFVDIWEGFVDAKGNFALSGYDVNGQTARLRANDGINFTLAGRRKLAFYAGQAIELLWGDTLEQQQLFDPANSGKFFNERVAPVNPMDIGAAGRPSLAGGAPFSPRPQNAAEKADNGKNTETQKTYRGRADDFSLAPASP